MIELIVAVGFITVGILGLNSLAIVAVRGNLSSRLIDQATRLAQAKIEQVKSAGYAAAAIGTTVESNLTPTGTPVAKTIATANSPAGISNAGGLFTRTTVIAAGGVGPTRTVSVSMQWNDHATQQTTFFTEIVGP